MSLKSSVVDLQSELRGLRGSVSFGHFSGLSDEDDSKTDFLDRVGRGPLKGLQARVVTGTSLLSRFS